VCAYMPIALHVHHMAVAGGLLSCACWVMPALAVKCAVFGHLYTRALLMCALSDDVHLHPLAQSTHSRLTHQGCLIMN
jgi:hypothetical protein